MENRRLTGTVVPRETLTAHEVEQLWAIFARLYDAVDEATFRADLAEKDRVLLLRDGPGGDIRGFTTILCLEVRVGGETLDVVYSGDTGIDPRYWGGQALVQAWGRFLGEVRSWHPERRLYWFLISKGYRTYLYLPFFFHRFYPRAEAPTPAFEQALIDHLARARYPGDYNAATGVVEFAVSHGHLKPALAETPAHRRQHPHVRFFLERNPGFTRGHELVCVAEIAADNMKGLGLRLLLDGARRLAAVS